MSPRWAIHVSARAEPTRRPHVAGRGTCSPGPSRASQASTKTGQATATTPGRASAEEPAGAVCVWGLVSGSSVVSRSSVDWPVQLIRSCCFATTPEYSATGVVAPSRVPFKMLVDAELICPITVRLSYRSQTVSAVLKIPYSCQSIKCIFRINNNNITQTSQWRPILNITNKNS